jgi:fructose-1,6-bisphosphatase/inositol monophosphatase family enzyme
MTVTYDFLERSEQLIQKTLRELRPELLAAFGTTSHEVKKDKSVVTKMDLLVEGRLHDVLREMDASVGFSGEETGTDYTQKTFWLADPIDGTEAFIRGLPFATNMIALIDDGEPVMGIIYNFALDEYYLGIKGRGATCNGQPIHVSGRPLERACIVFGGFPAFEISAELRKHVGSIAKLNGSGYEAALLARGAFDGKVVFGTKGAWDYAAGAILIQEAGGQFENINKTGYDYRDLNFVAGNAVCQPELKRLVEALLGKN